MQTAKQRLKYRVTALVIALALLCSVSLSMFAVAEPGDGIQSVGKAVNPMVKVLLRRLGIVDRMDITLSSAYGLSAGSGAELYFSGESQLSFQLKAGQIYLYYQGLSVNLGTDVTLSRYADAEAGEIGFRQTNYSPLYIGDLRLMVVENELRPILSIHVEDYLLGVVPYEMSDSFPLEALKAQTVAARTYVLRKQYSNPDYDVVDTTNDQVFKGYQQGFERSEQAVAETYGVCGYYKGALAQCYYAASNGGQTEQVNTVWPTKEDFDYYASVEDPYDLENPLSTVKKAIIKKSYSNQGDDRAPYGLRSLLATALKDRLTALGYDPAPESVMVHEVSDMRLDTPLSDDTPKLLSMLHMTVKISGRTRTEGQSGATQNAVNAVDLDTEEVSLFTTPAPPTPAITETTAVQPTVTPQPTPSPTPVPVYGEFTEISESITLDIPVFPIAEAALAMSISGNYENELWTLRETTTEYVVESRRFGHGVGMSQRGAEWMAGVYQKTYQDILSFYYPGMKLMRFDATDIPLRVTQAELSATAGPPPSPTPRPTLMPVTIQPENGQWYALVTGIDDDSSLNLRSLPDMSGDIVIRLFKNQRLLVLERCQEQGWVKVKTDIMEGYVMESYLSAE